MRNTAITALFATIIFGMPLLPVLAQSQNGNRETAPPAGQMMMGGMMADCQKHCDAMSATMADMRKTIAAAEQLNDLSKLHAALDHVQAGMSKMEGQMKECRGAMQKMMPMQGGGMMNQPPPGR